MPKICIIVAYSRNHVIGLDGDMPWRLKGDLAYFKKTTMGCPIIMGRKTRDSLGRPLPGRLNIAITRDTTYKAEGTETLPSLEDALKFAKKHSETRDIFIIGGGQIYKQALPLADRVYATEIQHEFKGDTFFPQLDGSEWIEISRDPQLEENGISYDFVVYEKGVNSET
ncbi:dihydrofolate reductase [Taylorella asinigenitalis 14/45]|uniref:Dihydrofolate reductase n=1 Tax=Taylorella asinigenitalis 14/45 TaxID=1091495 RepID=I7JNH7_9BURK|nr:dihydrofolate reductase [Taylorella asinigenitalis]CCG20065.1 dihydrofolate reductase [Taylorella asinigenitalis 14/45]